MSDKDEAAARRAGIVARLYRALDQKMGEIEDRIAMAPQSEADGKSAADSERDARTLTALARLLEKLSDLEGNGNKRTGKSGEGVAEKEIDADRLRRDLADRLERMLKARTD